MVDTKKPKVSGSPVVVLTCADCKQMRPIGGTRFVHPDLPHEAICEEDFALAWKYTQDKDHLRPLGPEADYDEDGTQWVRRICPRCGGKGSIPGFRGTCFRCWGYRWTYVCPANVQRVMRWSATFQGNRIPRSQL